MGTADCHSALRLINTGSGTAAVVPGALCLESEKASSIKYFTEEVPTRAKATQPDHIETLSVCLNFLRFVLLNVRIYVMVITASGSEVIR